MHAHHALSQDAKVRYHLKYKKQKKKTACHIRMYIQVQPVLRRLDWCFFPSFFYECLELEAQTVQTVDQGPAASPGMDRNAPFVSDRTIATSSDTASKSIVP